MQTPKLKYKRIAGYTCLRSKPENIRSQRALGRRREVALAVLFGAFAFGKGRTGEADLLASLISAFECEHLRIPSVIVMLKNTYIFEPHGP